MERNLQRAADYASKHESALCGRIRRHTRSPLWHVCRLSMGAVGVTVAKTTEAEVMLKAEPRGTAGCLSRARARARWKALVRLAREYEGDCLARQHIGRARHFRSSGSERASPSESSSKSTPDCTVLESPPESPCGNWRLRSAVFLDCASMVSLFIPDILSKWILSRASARSGSKVRFSEALETLRARGTRGAHRQRRVYAGACISPI